MLSPARLCEIRHSAPPAATTTRTAADPRSGSARAAEVARLHEEAARNEIEFQIFVQVNQERLSVIQADEAEALKREADIHDALQWKQARKRQRDAHRDVHRGHQ